MENLTEKVSEKKEERIAIIVETFDGKKTTRYESVPATIDASDVEKVIPFLYQILDRENSITNRMTTVEYNHTSISRAYSEASLNLMESNQKQLDFGAW